jgi:hypothetical protein
VTDAPTFATLTELYAARGIHVGYREGKPFHYGVEDRAILFEHVGEPLQCDTCTPPAQIQGGTDTRLGRLHEQYPELKAAADAAAKAFKDCTDGIKLEVSTLTGGALRAELAATDTAPALALTYGERWTLDSKAIKAEDPDTYVRYAKPSGAWTLKVKGSR